jgi:Ran GTPase-activating protein (RanGAP) involved in mRNA processing and transport
MSSISPRPNESSRYLFPVSSSEYVRPLSAVEIVQKFDIKATIEQALHGTKNIDMEGICLMYYYLFIIIYIFILICLTIIDDGSISFSDYRNNTNFLIDASKITPGAPIKRFLNDTLGKSNSVFGFRISGPILDNASIDELIIPIVEFGKFQYLVEVDFSYLILPKDSLNALFRTLNPVISGYCPIKRLVLTRSELGYYGCKSLFEAICGNLFLEELIITSCKCTDKAIPYLLKTLINNQNRLRVLGLGGNYLSIESIRELYPVFATHRYLKDIDLHCNPIGDEGTDMLLKSIRDNNLIVTLNLSACDIKDCKWATRLQIMTALATLNLSHNKIDDEGCHNLCDSLEECVCLRHLDISNNIFRSLGSISLGRMIEKNKALVTLNLSSNTGIIEEVFIAISAGLRENKTLNKLNLSSCDLNIDNAEIICQCFADNVTCDVNMSVSNIPEILQSNPRQYTRSKEREKEASRPKVVPTNKVIYIIYFIYLYLFNLFIY